MVPEAPFNTCLLDYPVLGFDPPLAKTLLLFDGVELSGIKRASEDCKVNAITILPPEPPIPWLLSFALPPSASMGFLPKIKCIKPPSFGIFVYFFILVLYESLSHWSLEVASKSPGYVIFTVWI